jgi:Tol biopolymer transport system component
VVLYEMLTGKQPFAGATVSDTLAAVLKTEPDLAQVPAQAQKLLQSCLEKDPKRRLRDIGDALRLLEEPRQAESGPTTSSRISWVVAGLLAVIAAVALALLWRAPRPTSQPLVRLSVELPELALMEGMQPGASVVLSPDGKRIVYTGRGADGMFRLYTRTLDQEQATTLAGTEGAYGPFFSPDGQAVGFFASGKLKKTSVERGGVVVLCDASQGVGGSWGEDGNIIAALNGFDGILTRIPSGGGMLQPLESKPERKEYGRWPQVLPGAKAVLFTADKPGGGSSIEVQSLRTGERKTLMRGGSYGRYVPTGHLLYLHQGMLYAASMDVNRLELTGPAVPVVDDLLSSASYGFAQADFSQNGTLVYVRGKPGRQTLVWLDSTGHTQTLRAEATEYNGTVRFSPDGKRLAVSVTEGGNANVWVYEWERDTFTRLTFTSAIEAAPVWSPDGKHLVFLSDRHGGGLPNLYWIRADGAGEAVRLTESKNFQVPFSFSPDGKRLAFTELDSQTNGALWTLPLGEMESDHPKPGKPEPFLVTQFNEFGPMISPDGRWLAYQSNQSGRYEVYVRPFLRQGGQWQISTGGGDWPVWSKKGPELFYRSSEGMMIASYTTNGDAFVASKPRLWVGKKDRGNSFDLVSCPI